MNYESHPSLHQHKSPLLLVLSGLSGAGKDAVLNRLKKSATFSLEHIRTVTTRPKRAKETDNIDYHFISEAAFQGMIKRNELLEWANVYGNWYGVPRNPVKQALNEGKDTVIKVDVQGATTIKKLLPQAVFIFVTPPSIEDLVLRLKQRRTESPSDLDLRIKTAEDELTQLSVFDYLVLNRQNEIERAVSDIEAIITAEKRRIKQREIIL